jgi:hypothetical protein
MHSFEQACKKKGSPWNAGMFFLSIQSVGFKNSLPLEAAAVSFPQPSHLQIIMIKDKNKFVIITESIYFRYMKEVEVKKLIELPKTVVKALDKLAEKDRASTKGYMEKVLIDHVKEKNEAIR